MDEKQVANLVAMFRSEAKDHLAALNRDLLAVERGPADGDRQRLLEEIFRGAHSLKGAARTVGFSQIENIAHHLESVFGAARRGQLALSPGVCDVLYEGLDAIEAILAGSPAAHEVPIEPGDLIERLEIVRQGDESLGSRQSSVARPRPRPESPLVSLPALAEEAPTGTDETIRVDIAKIEVLMAQASEMLVSKISAEQRLTDLKAIRADLDRQNRAWRKQSWLLTHPSHNGHRDSAAMADLLNANQAHLSTLSRSLKALEQSLASDTLKLGLVIEDMQDSIRQVRMLPFSIILGGFERMVRDLGRELGKEVVVAIQGAEVELDKKVLEYIRDPIMHLLRNAVDHGIEPPDEREVAGKPSQGTINLVIAHQGGLVSITVEDDGRGLDMEAIKQAALRGRVISETDLETMSAEAIARLALLPEVSTREQVTDLSGRGIGLDVVRQRMESLQGRIEIASQPGQGSCFQMIVPVSLATARGLLVAVMDEVYALPLSAIVKVVAVQSTDIRAVGGREMITIDGQPTALVRLVDVLERPLPAADTPAEGLAVLIRAGGTQIAYLVDDALGEQEMVIKGLGTQLARVRNVAGATLLGSGQVVIILNPAELVRSTQRAPSHGSPTFAARQTEAQRQRHILVVDDSITTRSLEKNILEAAGYTVITAVDGQDAISGLHNNDIDVIVADIQMPRMNGFELTEAVKSSDVFGELPVILVTSLDSQADRERGLAAGADAYIVKSAFDQEDLLATIEQFL